MVESFFHSASIYKMPLSALRVCVRKHFFYSVPKHDITLTPAAKAGIHFE